MTASSNISIIVIIAQVALFSKFESFDLSMQSHVIVLQLQYTPTTVLFGINALPPNVAVTINLFIGSPAIVRPEVEVPEVVIYPILVGANWTNRPFYRHALERVISI